MSRNGSLYICETGGIGESAILKPGSRNIAIIKIGSRQIAIRERPSRKSATCKIPIPNIAIRESKYSHVVSGKPDLSTTERTPFRWSDRRCFQLERTLIHLDILEVDLFEAAIVGECRVVELAVGELWIWNSCLVEGRVIQFYVGVVCVDYLRLSKCWMVEWLSVDLR